MLKLNKIFIILFAALILNSPSVKCAEEEEPMSVREAAVFTAGVMQHVLGNYVGDIEVAKLLEGSLHGMLSSIDPNCEYLTPKEFADLKCQTEGQYGGIGIEVTLDNETLKIITPLDDTPAYKSGLKPNDIIVKIDDKPVTGMTLRNIVDILKGDPGSKVKLTIQRKGVEDFDVTITREIIDIIPVKAHIKDHVLYIRISTFNQKTTRLLKEAIEKHIGMAKGVIIDVRNNVGGLLEEAVGASNLFLPSNLVIVSVKGKQKDSESKFISQEEDQTRGLPIVVLINEASASASEILAGAIKDNKRGVLVGVKSYGKGSVQKVVPLSNGGAIKLTEALYYTPDGQSIQSKGIIPNFEIKDPDQQLKKALELAKGRCK